MNRLRRYRGESAAEVGDSPGFDSGPVTLVRASLFYRGKHGEEVPEEGLEPLIGAISSEAVFETTRRTSRILALARGFSFGACSVAIVNEF